MEINVGIESSFDLRGIKLYFLSELKIKNLSSQLQEIFFCKNLPIFDRISLRFDRFSLRFDRISSTFNRISSIFDKYSSIFDKY